MGEIWGDMGDQNGSTGGWRDRVVCGRFGEIWRSGAGPVGDVEIETSGVVSVRHRHTDVLPIVNAAG